MSYDLVPEQFDVDLGDSHWLLWADLNGESHYGAWVKHLSPYGGFCGGFVRFLGPEGDKRWELISVNPPTFSPSLLCSCGDHGWVRDGKWVRA